MASLYYIDNTESDIFLKKEIVINQKKVNTMLSFNHYSPNKKINKKHHMDRRGTLNESNSNH